MIKKALLFFLLLFLLNLIIRNYYKPNIILSQSQWQTNQILAQTYLYSNTDTIDNIIVGSSIAYRIHLDSLPRFYSLAFGGESPLQGLEVLRKKKKAPKRIFIEMNVILKNDESNFLDALNNPLLAPLREHSSIFRDGKQPLPLLAALTRHHLLEKIIPERFMFPNIPTRSKTDKIIINKTEHQEDEIKLHPKQYENMTKIYDHLEFFKKNGSEIIFFEMPTNLTDCNSNIKPKYRVVVEKMFPLNKYIYLPTPIYGSYETTDGIHLGKEEAARYTHYLKLQIDSLIKIQKHI